MSAQPFQSVQSTQPAQQPKQPVAQSVYQPQQKLIQQLPSGVFTVASASKSGVGKTTVTVALALALSKAGIKTLTWDLDFVGPNVHNFFNIKDKLDIKSIAGKHITIQTLTEIIKSKKIFIYYPVQWIS